MSKYSEDQIKDYYQALPKPQFDDAKQDRLWEQIDSKIDSGIKQKKKGINWILPKKLIAGVAVVLLTLLIFSPEIMHSTGMTMGSSLQSLYKNYPAFKGKKILPGRFINDGKLIFYKPNIPTDGQVESQLDAVFIKKTFWGGWRVTNYRGGYSSGIKKPFYIDYLPSGKSGLSPLLFGEVKDSKIHRLYIYGKDKQHELPISIVTSYGKKNKFVMWYAFVNLSNGPIFTIIAKDINGDQIAAKTYDIQTQHEANTTMSTVQFAINRVIGQHPDFPKKPGTKKIKLPTGGPQGSFANVDLTTSVKKINKNSNGSTYIVTFTKDWHLTVNGTYVKSIWKYQVTPFDVKTLEVKDLDHLPNEMK